MDTLYTNLKVTNLPNAELEIEATIEEEKLESYKKKVLKNLGKDAKVPGFRPGHVPDNILLERIGEQGLLQEAAELALQDAYPAIILEKGLQTIGRPEISITKLAAGNPFEFKIKTATVPEITLPDYKKIAKEEMAVLETITVDQKEIDDVVNEIRKTRTQVERAKDSDDKGDELPKVDPTEVIEEKDLLPLTDEFVATLGEFKTVDDFKKAITENLTKEKEVRSKEKKRIAISESIIKDSKIDLPQILIDSELEKMKSQFTEDIIRMGADYDEYLAKIGKTEEDLMKEWIEPASKRAKLQLILNRISIDEKIIPSKEEVDTQVKHLKEHYKDAEEDRIRIYVETMLTNEKVYDFLEGSKDTKVPLEENKDVEEKK